jgi:hypothetical protein
VGVEETMMMMERQFNIFSSIVRSGSNYGRMKDMMASRYGDLSYALGGRSRAVLSNGEPVDSIGSWRPNLKVIRAVLRYVTNTGRLEGEIGR